MEIVKTIALKKSKLILIVSKTTKQQKIRPGVTSTEADQRIYTGLETGMIISKQADYTTILQHLYRCIFYTHFYEDDILWQNTKREKTAGTPHG